MHSNRAIENLTLKNSYRESNLPYGLLTIYGALKRVHAADKNKCTCKTRFESKNAFDSFLKALAFFYSFQSWSQL